MSTIFNKNVELFYNAATEVFKDKGFDYELIFVNDGSRDQTMDKLRHIYEIADENVKVVGFSRNFGKESAIYAWLKESKGEMVCLIDADMQQRPELVLFFGIVYIWDAMTVVIQRVYFKATHGKRIFRMTPIHHAFEMRGWKEVKIDAFFALIAAIGMAMGMLYICVA